MRTLPICALGILFLANTAMAQFADMINDTSRELDWLNPSSWINPATFETGVVPDGTYYTRINQGQRAGLSGNAAVLRLGIEGTSPAGTILTLYSGGTLTVNDQLTVGSVGRSGTVNIQTGALLTTATSAFFGIFDRAATLNISGGRMTVGSQFYMGNGSGAISNGGTLTVAAYYGAFHNATSGTMTVDGVNSALRVNGSMDIGYTASHTVNIINGASGSNSGFTTIGRSAGSSGELNISGAESRFTSGSSLEVGLSGNGKLTVSNGAAGSNGGFLSIGRFNTAGTASSMTVTGTGSSWVSSGAVTVGGTSATAGSGTLTLSNGGALTAAGQQITINRAATMNIGTGGNAGVLNAGSVANNGTLSFNHTNNISFGMAISGSTGMVIKSGTGTLTLTAGNPFSGTMAVNGGLVRVASPGFNGIAPSMLILASGTLEAAAAVNNAHTLTGLSMQGGSLTGSNPDSQWGNFVINGNVAASGTLPSTISASVVQINGVRTFDIADGATLNVSSRLANANTSTGGITKTGGGLLTLTGSNTYTLGTTVSSGTLAGTTTAIRGAVTNNARVVLDQNVSGTFTGTMSGSGMLEKKGTGTVVINGSNSYAGGTLVTGGTLSARNNFAVGSGLITVGNDGVFVVELGTTVANDVILTGGALARQLAGGFDLAGSVEATSQFAGGRPDTTATLLGGSTSSATTLTMQFSAPVTGMPQSDVLHLGGVPPLASGQPGETDVFVLQLSVAGITADSYLGWLDPETDAWVNAVTGNFGGAAFFAGDHAYNPLTDFQVGTYGVDTANQTVWAVLNHNSDFAVVPEPRTALLFLASGLFLLFRRHKA